MEIQEATIENIPVIHKLAYDIWPVTYKNIISPSQLSYMLDLLYSSANLQKQMEEQGHRFIILYDYIYNSKLPVGFASFSKKSHGYPAYKLHKLYVLPNQQGKGSGRFLINYIISTITKEGGSVLELNVNRDNPAQYFYHKLGFTITKEEDIDIGHGYFMNDYVMEKVIGHGPWSMV